MAHTYIRLSTLHAKRSLGFHRCVHLQQRVGRQRQKRWVMSVRFSSGDETNRVLAWSTSPLPPMILVHRRKENSSLSFSKRLRQTF